ncbi:hypothetical protein SAMN04488000_10993 [Lentzea albida]|uniref:Uncharacterized protein n=1 Tax=Lentzea albida TaxID=65499 RepID=A0A1H9PFR7_9PSEU|nr:hypothetical protein SAMN04488000_10993 [Lentzea albida]
MAGVTVPPGLRQPPYEQPRGNFETIEVYAPVTQVPPRQEPPRPAPPRPGPEPVEESAERSDIAVIGPIAAVVLALTVSTLVLDHPAARAVAAGLATIGLIVAVALMLMGRKPKPGRHVARHAVDPEATDRIAPPGWGTTDRRR